MLSTLSISVHVSSGSTVSQLMSSFQQVVKSLPKESWTPARTGSLLFSEETGCESSRLDPKSSVQTDRHPWWNTVFLWFPIKAHPLCLFNFFVHHSCVWSPSSPSSLLLWRYWSDCRKHMCLVLHQTSRDLTLESAPQLAAITDVMSAVLIKPFTLGKLVSPPPTTMFHLKLYHFKVQGHEGGGGHDDKSDDILYLQPPKTQFMNTAFWEQMCAYCDIKM